MKLSVCFAAFIIVSASMIKADEGDGSSPSSGIINQDGLQGKYSNDGKGNVAWSMGSPGSRGVVSTGNESPITWGNNNQGNPINGGSSSSPLSDFGGLSLPQFGSNSNQKNAEKINSESRPSSGTINQDGLEGIYSNDGKGNVAWTMTSPGGKSIVSTGNGRPIAWGNNQRNPANNDFLGGSFPSPFGSNSNNKDVDNESGSSIGGNRPRSGTIKQDGLEGVYSDDGEGNSAWSMGSPGSEGVAYTGNRPSITWGNQGRGEDVFARISKQMDGIFSSLFGSNSNQRNSQRSGSSGASNPFHFMDSFGFRR